MRMSDLKVVITGASGFIGAPLVKKLAKLGCDVLAISRSVPASNIEDSVEWLEADLSSVITYKEKVELFAPEVIIHLAWSDIPDYSFKKSIENLNQSLEFLSFISELESCKKILVSGSCWEFNKSKGECLENEICEPKNNFTWAKHSIQSWLDMTCKQKDIDYGWFRIFYVYGPGQRTASLIPSILTHLKNGRLPELNTPENANDFIFIDDVISALSLAATGELSSGVYNIGSGNSTSVLDVCRIAEKVVCGTDVLSKQLENSSKENVERMDFWAGINSTKKRLAWEPETLLVDGIEQMWLHMGAQ